MHFVISFNTDYKLGLVVFGRGCTIVECRESRNVIMLKFLEQARHEYFMGVLPGCANIEHVDLQTFYDLRDVHKTTKFGYRLSCTPLAQSKWKERDKNKWTDIEFTILVETPIFFSSKKNFWFLYPSFANPQHFPTPTAQYLQQSGQFIRYSVRYSRGTNPLYPSQFWEKVGQIQFTEPTLFTITVHKPFLDL